MHGEVMDYADFEKLTTTTIRGMYDRIPQKYHDGFEDLFIGGEHHLAIDMLISGLKRFHTPITPQERATLARLLPRVRKPESELDGITVTGETDGEPPP